uniref:Uncharacterized protein n=1 Tax=Brassica oleracea var. oleracea TaxID=109376 RepID=A0A0D3A2F5_BRAOL
MFFGVFGYGQHLRELLVGRELDGYRREFPSRGGKRRFRGWLGGGHHRIGQGAAFGASGTPEGVEGAGGGYGGRGACCLYDTTVKLPGDVWGGDVYGWSSLEKLEINGSRGGFTSNEVDYGGRGGGTGGMEGEGNGRISASGGDGYAGGGGGRVSVHIYSRHSDPKIFNHGLASVWVYIP